MKTVVLLLVSLIIMATGIAHAIDFSDIEIGTINRKREQVQTQGVTGASLKCGVKLNLPPGWKVVRNDPNSVDVQGPQGMFLAIVMSDYGADFPVDSSLQAYEKRAQEEKQQGKLIDGGERVIDGVLGIQRVEAPMPDPGDPRRITWIGYKGTVGINIVASSKSKDFDRCYPTLNQIVGSIKW